MKSTSHRIAHRAIDLLLCTVVTGFLALPGQRTLAAEAARDGEVSAPVTAAPTPSALALAQSFRGPVASAKAASQPRMGMHVVVRLVVTMEAHPDSGDVRLALRSKLLKGSIAKTPVAVAVAWRF